jgi:hypothetical protein
MDANILVECADVVDFPCDVLVLKYAQAFFGVDAMVARILRSLPKSSIDITPREDEYSIVPSDGKIAAGHVIFLGVSPLHTFDYKGIRHFAYRSMQILAAEMPFVKTIAMTMHGVGYGLDERESFLSQIAGLLDAIRDRSIPSSLEQIIIIEKSKPRAERIGHILSEYLPIELTKVSRVFEKSKIDAGIKSNSKPQIFVAMPSDEEMEDIYIFGIQGPVNTAGYLCERMDRISFTGDILELIKSRIDSAALVIADLTGANPNVYLEVGYAWGKNRPTLLIAKNNDELKFDVKGQRCIIYKNIADLVKKLETDLHNL